MIGTAKRNDKPVADAKTEAQKRQHWRRQQAGQILSQHQH
jgi:hypothetical protein